jgi:hypothetical protein
MKIYVTSERVLRSDDVDALRGIAAANGERVA